MSGLVIYDADFSTAKRADLYVEIEKKATSIVATSHIGVDEEMVPRLIIIKTFAKSTSYCGVLNKYRWNDRAKICIICLAHV